MSLINEQVDSFIPKLGTVRSCLDCGTLVIGGPTRCVWCAGRIEAPLYREKARVLTPEYHQYWMQPQWLVGSLS